MPISAKFYESSDLEVIHRVEESAEQFRSQGLWRSGMAVHKPARLRAGARVGVVAPAGCVERDSLDAGVDAIRAAGFQSS